MVLNDTLMLPSTLVLLLFFYTNKASCATSAELSKRPRAVLVQAGVNREIASAKSPDSVMNLARGTQIAGKGKAASVVCNVLDYGASGSRSHDVTVAFRNAISACDIQRPAGGIADLVVPPGDHLTGPFNLTSHMRLIVQEGATIFALDDFTAFDLMPPLPSYGSGREFPGLEYIPFIGCFNCSSVTVTGGGIIDGQGQAWWDAFHGGGILHTRPRLIQFRSSHNVEVRDVTLRNSPFWTLHFVYCDTVRVKGVTIRSPVGNIGGSWKAIAPNTDGIDPDSSKNVLIENCDISTGDDAIAIKSGWDQYGREVGIPAENIVIQNSVFHGIPRPAPGEKFPCCNTMSIGSEMSGGVRNVTIQNVILNNTYHGLYIKSARGRGGYVEDIWFSNIVMHGTNQAITVAANYRDVHPNQTSIPLLRNIHFSNIQVTGVDKAVQFFGLPDSFITGVNIENSSFMPQHQTLEADQQTGETVWHKWAALQNRHDGNANDISSLLLAAGWNAKAFECRYVAGWWMDVTPIPCPELSHRNKIDIK